MPLFWADVSPHHGGMSTTNFLRVVAQDRTGESPKPDRPAHHRTRSAVHSGSDGPSTGRSAQLLVEPREPEPSTAPSPPGWARLGARLLTTSIDRRLAEGRATDSSRLVAARARLLVSPAARGVLADNWDNLLIRAHRAPGLRDPRVRLNRDWIVACEPEVRRVVQALRGPGPLAARGVAMASGLLSDGTGPLFNRRRSAELGSALRGVNAHLR
jgi:hypothetical protein